MDPKDQVMKWADLGCTVVRYELRPGIGQPLVLVHEMGGSLNSWDRMLSRLDTRRPVLRYDMRGSGMSEKLRDVPYIEELADDLLRLLDALGLTEPVAIGASALGCAVALLCAARHPLRVASVVAMSPVTEVAAVRRLSLLGIADRMEREGLRAMVDASLAVSYPPALIDDREVFQHFRARWMANDPVSFALLYRMLADLDVRPALSQVVCPVLVIAGLQDALRPAELSRHVAAQIPGSTLIALDSGHFMHVQSAAEVAVALARFIDAAEEDAAAIKIQGDIDEH
jgi:pimeloyl-ACP methyl ester carboxylesterase